MDMEKYFGTSNLYEVLELQPTAEMHESKYTCAEILKQEMILLFTIRSLSLFYRLVKSNYYKLARVCHPDRVVEAEKIAAKEKFNILNQAYLILVNPTSRKAYDDGDKRVLFASSSTSSKWDSFIKTLSDDDIEIKRRNYQGSISEENDIIREIQAGKGSITHLFNTIPFMRYEDEERIINIVKDCMDAGKVPKMTLRKMRN